ncbi:hypothetical protein Hte_000325 [Hypoxylon texense]
MDSTIHKDDDAASVAPTTTIATATTSTAAASTSTPPLTPSTTDTSRDGRSQPHETKNQELRQYAADQNMDDDNKNKEVQVLDGDQVLLTSADNWLMETNGTLNDGLRKLNARRLRVTKRNIAKGREEGISSLALWDAPDINVLRRWAD